MQFSRLVKGWVSIFFFTSYNPGISITVYTIHNTYTNLDIASDGRIQGRADVWIKSIYLSDVQTLFIVNYENARILYTICVK